MTPPVGPVSMRDADQAQLDQRGECVPSTAARNAAAAGGACAPVPVGSWRGLPSRSERAAKLKAVAVEREIPETRLGR
jgi:hypothetical protein